MNSPIYIPFFEKVNNFIKTLPKKARYIFLLFVGFLFLGAFGLLFEVNSSFLITIPARGGSVTEGIVGTPRFINPILALSDADRDLTTLVYSGLMRPNESGILSPDIASSYDISEDGLTYTFIIKDDALFHDGVPITATDIVFTISKAQDASLKSPRRASWEGVTVEAAGDKIVRFVLKQPYAPFLENTTLGILPKHIWNDINSSQFGFSKFNTEAIGSGPYKITRVKRDASGVPEYYDLISFNHFSLGEPYIKTLRIKFYNNEQTLLDAYKSGKIESVHAIAPYIAHSFVLEKKRVETTPLPRVFGIFFNQNQAAIFTDKSVREALEKVIDRESIIENVLRGYATPIDGPLPPGALGFIKKSPDINKENQNAMEEAKNILENNGWTKNKEDGIYEKKTKKGVLRLSFSLTTSDTNELKETAELIKNIWNTLGADVTLRVFDIVDINQNIIRPRMYDALLFGEIIGRDADPFAFWHSSQRLDPGLNIALYTNITVDKLLEDARKISAVDYREEKYNLFQKEIKKDVPAIFIYAPNFIYVIPNFIKGFKMDSISIPSDRFSNIHNWYINTDRVWKIFAK